MLSDASFNSFSLIFSFYRWEPISLLILYCIYVLVMCFNVPLEKFFSDKLSFIPFLKVSKEWYAQQEGKSGLVPKEVRVRNGESICNGNGKPTKSKSETSSLIGDQQPSNGSMDTLAAKSGTTCDFFFQLLPLFHLISFNFL